MGIGNSRLLLEMPPPSPKGIPVLSPTAPGAALVAPAHREFPLRGHPRGVDNPNSPPGPRIPVGGVIPRGKGNREFPFCGNREFPVALGYLWRIGNSRFVEGPRGPQRNREPARKHPPRFCGESGIPVLWESGIPVLWESGIPVLWESGIPVLWRTGNSRFVGTGNSRFVGIGNSR